MFSEKNEKKEIKHITEIPLPLSPSPPRKKKKKKEIF